MRDFRRFCGIWKLGLSQFLQPSDNRDREFWKSTIGRGSVYIMRKSWIKGLGMTLAAALWIGGTAGPAAPASAAGSGFTDVKSSHWAASSIAAGVTKGYVSGYTNGTFKPEASISRAEFVKMVVSALGLEVGGASGKWYAPYVTAAAEKGLYTAADFANSDAAWSQTITRAEMARIAARAAGETATENDKWMYLATKKGLITGLGKGELGLNEATSRAQSVVIIERILSAKAGKKLSVDSYAVGSAEIAWHGTNIFTVMPEVWRTTSGKYAMTAKDSPEELWDEEAMTITSKNGKYKAQLDAVIAIDLEDPKDPNLKLLPPIEKLKWFNNRPSIKNLMVADWKKSYIVYFKKHTIFNNDPDHYGNELTAYMTGFASNDDAFYNGTLNNAANVYLNKWDDFPAQILPKTGWTNDYGLKISINTPAGSQAFYSHNTIFSIQGNKSQ
ncbi:S-layer homology domain-containing protein [Saccharibacillus sp. CPCC 101409]|uniref:S-layer homology domain-containing protein n=1 Tax=Saccharibacillus sp. CPCC 101409 TaxID=3058041 RepID=UPI0026734591|nr:S-layer homology domain-containing protein [Saccharibacillus sp. CPCC 101409]MDO3413376.1 S-layer homology domain-containing protein [Saccharibacillus sp. CPCC 101409]